MVCVLFLARNSDENIADETAKGVKDVAWIIDLGSHDTTNRDWACRRKKVVQIYGRSFTKELSEITVIGLEIGSLRRRGFLFVYSWRCRPVMKFGCVDPLQANGYSPAFVNCRLAHLPLHRGSIKGVGYLEGRAGVCTKSEGIGTGKQNLDS